MKITIESTTEMTEVNGIPCRVWEGESERGVKVQCLITSIAVLSGEDYSQFQAELKEHRPPVAKERAYSMRMVL